MSKIYAGVHKISLRGKWTFFGRGITVNLYPIIFQALLHRFCLFNFLIVPYFNGILYAKFQAFALAPSEVIIEIR
jgi:hypothetical protein